MKCEPSSYIALLVEVKLSQLNVDSVLTTKLKRLYHIPYRLFVIRKRVGSFITASVR